MKRMKPLFLLRKHPPHMENDTFKPILPEHETTHSELSPARFYAAWKKVCDAMTSRLLDNWENGGNYSSVIFGDKATSVAVEVGRKLELDCYFNYYSLDAVYFHRAEDTVPVPPAPPESTWLQNIRIAFEHENYFRSGLFQEVSHLMIARAQLRVLVTYPETNDPTEVEKELAQLHHIIEHSGLPDPAFLLIMGKRTPVGREPWSGIEWIGKLYTPKCWVAIQEPN